jgi:hypothetical protein
MIPLNVMEAGEAVDWQQLCRLAGRVPRVVSQGVGNPTWLTGLGLLERQPDAAVAVPSQPLLALASGNNTIIQIFHSVHS